jgi:5'-methylthioadenosine phosphorylase
MAEALRSAVEAGGQVVRFGGTYVCTEGPRLETPAEIRKYRLLGAHVVGMTLCPEVFLARELELCYGAILYITNYAEGIRPAAARPEQLFGGLASPDEQRTQEQAVRELPAILQRAAAARRRLSVECSCQRSMERYRRSGVIGADWRRWMPSTWRRPM